MSILTKISYCFGLFLLILSAHSNTQHLTANKLLTLEIAKEAPTSIVLDQQKIADVFFYPEEAAKVILHQSGMVFVVPTKDHDHVYITLMGENGTAQDCQLTFAIKPPEPIRLTDKNTMITESYNTNKEDKPHDQN